MSRAGTAFVLLAVAAACAAGSGARAAQATSSPRASPDVPVLAFAPIDPPALRLRDEALQASAGPGPLRFAEPLHALATPATDGAWRTEADGTRTWQLAVEVPEATDLNFGFRRFGLPPGATLTISTEDGAAALEPYQAGDGAGGQLWTGILPGSRAVLTLVVPPGAAEPGLELGQVGAGYRDILREIEPALPLSGACNNDVACPEGDPWRDEIRSAIRYTIGGGGLCSGTLVVDVPRTWRPFVLTANHCGVTAGTAPSIVTYWRYQAGTCGGPRDGAANAVSQSGAQFRAAWRDSDMALFELSAPPVAGATPYWAGWDRSDVEPVASVAIHHPSGDEKAITFDDDPLTKGDNCIDRGTDTHWYVGAYEDGTTEPGSSGSGIWDAVTHLLVGTLSGGRASCTNLTYDCWGRFGRHWDSGATAAERLRDWLDPAGTGAVAAPGGEPGSAPAIELESLATADACALGLGDANGVIEPGETVTLVPTLRALGGTFTSVTGALSTADPGLTLADPAATWPDLAPAAPRASDPPHLQVVVDPDVACGSVLRLVLSVSGTEGGPFALPIDLTVGEPSSRPVVPVGVPDLGTAASPLTVTRDVVITALSVRVRMTHSYVGDLRLQLETPASTRVTLLDRPGHPAVTGGCPDDDLDILFDDAAPMDLETHCAATTPWYSGAARPTIRLGLLAGERTVGQWRLIAADLGAGDAGTIDDWELITTPSIAGRCEACEDCPGQPIAGAPPDVLRVRKGMPGTPVAGAVILSFPGASSACADGVQVRMSPTARPSSGSGLFPADPPFANVTVQDADPGPEFRHAPVGTQYYLVVEDLGGRPGPSGSYGN